MTEGERYQRYLAGREWGLLKEAVRKRAGGVCERCRHFPMASVHHLTYIRKYRERLEDLQALCEGCHAFTHGKSDHDPLKYAPVKAFGREIEVVYLAGKIDGHQDWRLGILNTERDGNPLYIGDDLDSAWELCEDIIILPDGRKLDYSGPFISGGGHCTVLDDTKHGGFANLTLPRLCMRAIDSSDLLFAWIDSEDCFGTLLEIGYAKGLNKVVFIAGPKSFPELWFAYASSHRFLFDARSPLHAFHALLIGSDSNFSPGNGPFDDLDLWIKSLEGGYFADEGSEFIYTEDLPS